ncbi:MAG: beta-lactamase family protein [Balneolaceae bacterium]|nr:beta-lactamase family protein [Balneolaceae bacterium]
MIYVVGFISFVALFIYLVWKVETKIPSIPKRTNSSSYYYDELVEWFKLLAEKKKFNGVVSLTRGEDVLFECCLGFRDVELKYRIDEHTRFRLASISKQFTAIGVMVLFKKYPFQESYDTLLVEIIPEFPYQDVSIRHLLNQTSGIDVDYMSLAKGNRKEKDRILTIQDALDIVCREEVKNPVQPSTRFSYNNTNYIILAALIERVSGVSFEEFMKKEVFEPLELKDTMVWNLSSRGKLSELNNVASDFEQYLNTKPRLLEPTWIDGVAGDGGIFSSLHDLKQWMKILESNPIITTEEMREAFQEPMLTNGERSEYGFGWVIDGDYVWHNGMWLGTNTFIMKDRNTDTMFVMIDNASNLRFDTILYLVKEQVFGNHI